MEYHQRHFKLSISQAIIASFFPDLTRCSFCYVLNSVSGTTRHPGVNTSKFSLPLSPLPRPFSFSFFLPLFIPLISQPLLLCLKYFWNLTTLSYFSSKSHHFYLNCFYSFLMRLSVPQHSLPNPFSTYHLLSNDCVLFLRTLPPDRMSSLYYLEQHPSMSSLLSLPL